jgi:hypothetical protein
MNPDRIQHGIDFIKPFIKDIKTNIHLYCPKEQQELYLRMGQVLYNIEMKPDRHPETGFIMGLVKTGDKICSVLQENYFKKFPEGLEGQVLTDESKEKIKEAINEYFKDKNKDGKLIFVKGCFFGTYLKERCRKKILKRIEEFVEKIKKVLLSDIIPVNNFRLGSIVNGINPDSISRALEFLSEQEKTDDAVKALKLMCSDAPSTPPEVPQEQELIQESVVTSGGRRSRYRRRPTKKYFKSRHRRHSSSKKKRHMKTKRHMKRHRKTKRHTKRY